ncbi:isochorismatase family protein [Streptomyces sp. LE64]|uniref:isochorismatase family protein n=1 Tax=Streptomyces sp. LE64 TaxID=3448653 RepID=UPI00404147C1
MSGIPRIAGYPLPGEADLPPNTARWTVRPDRAALLVHDVQEYFLRPFAPAQRREPVENVALLRDGCARLGMPVAFTAQPGSMTPQQRGLLNTGDVHALRGTHFAGVQFHPESVLTRGGVRVLDTLLADVLTGVPRPARA